ncbi:unnamed protein product [Paramecium sonneborni]|uniref:Protein kinase domain-containing protein n=1 Tax=Paramecium sonneborni TaxID=65129 RepID=A0A8S1NGF5_9CILI|nr:unnamed protein product [Paramecium sonneborni]
MNYYQGYQNLDQDVDVMQTSQSTNPNQQLEKMEQIKKQIKENPHINIAQIISFQYNNQINMIESQNEVCDFTLADYFKIRQSQWFQKDEIVNIISQIVSGYMHLKQLKITHRDLNPSILLVKSLQGNTQIIIKISDFGVASYQESKMYEPMGTPYYQAPEMKANYAYDDKCDIYSLGLIIFQMCFQNQYHINPVTMQELQHFNQYIKNNKFQIQNAQIDPTLKHLIERMIVYNPKERISWEELASMPLLKPRFLVVYNYSKTKQYYIDFQKSLGQGSQGTTFLTYDLFNPSIQYCTKQIDKNNIEGQREIDAYNLIKIDQNCENIIKIEEICYNQQYAYLVMEKCDMDIEQYLQQKQFNLSEEEVLDIFQQIVTGYLKIMSFKLIHRDLKPQNILVKLIDQTQRPIFKIIDFGVGKVLTQNLTTTQAGTPIYTAPEIFFHNGHNNQCDIFSLGVMMYYLVYGKNYFEYQPKSKEELFKILQNLQTRPVSCKPYKSFSSNLLKLIEQMLIYDQEKRIDWLTLDQQITEIIRGPNKCNIQLETQKKKPNIRIVSIDNQYQDTSAQLQVIQLRESQYQQQPQQQYQQQQQQQKIIQQQQPYLEQQEYQFQQQPQYQQQEQPQYKQYEQKQYQQQQQPQYQQQHYSSLSQSQYKQQQEPQQQPLSQSFYKQQPQQQQPQQQYSQQQYSQQQYSQQQYSQQQQPQQQQPQQQYSQQQYSQQQYSQQQYSQQQQPQQQQPQQQYSQQQYSQQQYSQQQYSQQQQPQQQQPQQQYSQQQYSQQQYSQQQYSQQQQPQQQQPQQQYSQQQYSQQQYSQQQYSQQQQPQQQQPQQQYSQQQYSQQQYSQQQYSQQQQPQQQQPQQQYSQQQYSQQQYSQQQYSQQQQPQQQQPQQQYSQQQYSQQQYSQQQYSQQQQPQQQQPQQQYSQQQQPQQQQPQYSKQLQQQSEGYDISSQQISHRLVNNEQEQQQQQFQNSSNQQYQPENKTSKPRIIIKQETVQNNIIQQPQQSSDGFVAQQQNFPKANSQQQVIDPSIPQQSFQINSQYPIKENLQNSFPRQFNIIVNNNVNQPQNPMFPQSNPITNPQCQKQAQSSNSKPQTMSFCQDQAYNNQQQKDTQSNTTIPLNDQKISQPISDLKQPTWQQKEFKPPFLQNDQKSMFPSNSSQQLQISKVPSLNQCQQIQSDIKDNVQKFIKPSSSQIQEIGLQQNNFNNMVIPQQKIPNQNLAPNNFMQPQNLNDPKQRNTIQVVDINQKSQWNISPQQQQFLNQEINITQKNFQDFIKNAFTVYNNQINYLSSQPAYLGFYLCILFFYQDIIKQEKNQKGFYINADIEKKVQKDYEKVLNLIQIVDKKNGRLQDLKFLVEQEIQTLNQARILIIYQQYYEKNMDILSDYDKNNQIYTQLNRTISKMHELIKEIIGKSQIHLKD